MRGTPGTCTWTCGVHPTCQGYGAMANQLIATINEAFGAGLEPVDLTELEGIPLPQDLVAGPLARSRTASALGLPRFEPPLGIGSRAGRAGLP